jgi:excisionase family DNA binding protein
MITVKDKNYYSIIEVAEMFNLKETTIRKYIREGRLKSSMKIGKRIYISLEHIEAFLLP